eukprot:CAMPEP_0183317310 /NCGR_PEP_ID=MMETSP0160_2-20130417/57589_1 /TAXON_ID=2839 ORGANISM="Odontella Sinensis, Strain Grunow 1884" /NCGR_SAMPLE_ID=MMETSP0160_2 /ASSEMBLY_ACC=CAM_ASM_000250 /LENGTH=47 /DNA_ID= /DNA_START= /DNA_END= /DNA_ORIENTATION=
MKEDSLQNVTTALSNVHGNFMKTSVANIISVLKLPVPQWSAKEKLSI